MYFKLFLLLLIWFEWVNLSIFVLLLNLLMTKYGKIIFAGFCTSSAIKYNEIANSFKVELFKDLNEMEKGEKLFILEVGAGSGANFKYYNRSALVQAVEPNQNFLSSFNENRAKYPDLDVKDMKIGYGEDLAAAGIGDNSVDAVVMTLVLCAVKDQQKCFQEIKRVLKPGGKFFFMEHIANDQNSLILLLQKILTEIGFWPFMFDGVCIGRATDEEMVKSGCFSNIQSTKYDLPVRDDSPIFLKFGGRTVFKRHVMGVATK